MTIACRKASTHHMHCVVQVATETVRTALKQEISARHQRGYELASWQLGRDLALKDMVILAWRLVPESEDVQHHQV